MLTLASGVYSVGTGTAEGLRPGEAELQGKRDREESEAAAQLEPSVPVWEHDTRTEARETEDPVEKGRQNWGYYARRTPRLERNKKDNLQKQTQVILAIRDKNSQCSPKCHLRRKR